MAWLPTVMGGVSSDYYFTGTLQAGDTTIEITDDYITDDCTFDVYFDNKILGYSNLVVSNHTCTITLEAQEEDLDILIKVHNVSL